jgi:hypothetical protein
LDDDTIRQIVIYENDFGWIDFWELNPEVLGSLWLIAFATWGGDHFGFGPSRLEKADLAPLELNPGISLTAEGKLIKPLSV